MAEQPQAEQNWLHSDVSDYSFRAADLNIQELRVIRFEAVESISDLFHVRIELASTNQEMAFDELVGRPGVLNLYHFNEQHERWINGIVSRFDYTSSGSQYSRYEVDLVPRVWLLGLRRQSRIFQEMSVPDIIQQVLTDAGIESDMFRMALTGTYKPRVYCVQYRETDLNFIKRLTEEEGIFFFFEHTELNHVMVFGDAPSVHRPIAGDANVPFRTPTQMVEGQAFVSEFRFGQQVRTGTTMLRDFNFENPKQNLDSERDSGENEGLEFYDYPGEYSEKGEGDRYANVRLEELRAFKKTARAVSVERRIQPGYRFNLTEHTYRSDLNGEYLVTRVTHRGCHRAAVEQEAGGRELADEPTYENRFEAIPYSVPFRPARVTPKPVVQGSQTAIVTGPSGEEIYTDKYGRVKVKFPWDREGVHDERSSCWIRVSQAWAGGKYGAMFIPRIAHEVIVDFLEGDPDQPIIVGRVYNNDEMPPYDLPANKTISTIRTANSKGQDGANELRFDDKKGSEQVFLHAEKNLHVRAKGSRCATIQGSDNLSVGGELREMVYKDRSRTVKGNEAISVEKTQSVHVTETVSYDFSADHHEMVGTDYSLEAGQNILIKASAAIRLEAAGGSITIGPGGIWITGQMVYINSGDSAVSVMGGQCVAPAEPAVADKETPGRDTRYTGEPRPPVPIPPEELEEKSWIVIEVHDEEGNPIRGEAFTLTTSDGTEVQGTLDVNGHARVRGIDRGTCQIRFPRRHEGEIRKG